jgi:succinate dehydrogenase/fumarate reductase cytochrome b subunit
MPKKYSISWENDEPVSFEVDGVCYEHLEDVPDGDDRSKLEAMMNGSIEQQFEKEFKDFDKEFEKDWEANKKSADNTQKLMLCIFTGVAVLMLLIAVVASASAILKMNREESAAGRVVEIIQRREYVNEQDRVVQDYYYPVVDFVSADGRSHSVQMTEGSSAPSHEVGEEVTVLYNPDHPLDARIKSFGSYALMWILPGITGILGLAFLGAVIVVRKVMPITESTEETLKSPTTNELA